jgi:hypothetical protein
LSITFHSSAAKAFDVDKVHARATIVDLLSLPKFKNAVLSCPCLCASFCVTQTTP